MREEQLPPPVGRSARARVADNVSRWLDWTEHNRTIWLGHAGARRGHRRPRHQARRRRARAPRRRAGRRSPRRHRPRLAPDALRPRVLDRPQPRRHPPLATRPSQPPNHPRTARHHPRAHPEHLRHATQNKPSRQLLLRRRTVDSHARQRPVSPLVGAAVEPADHLGVSVVEDRRRPRVDTRSEPSRQWWAAQTFATTRPVESGYITRPSATSSSTTRSWSSRPTGACAWPSSAPSPAVARPRV